MSDTGTATKAKKERYKGSIDRSAPAPAPPVQKDTGVDLTQFETVLRDSWAKKQANNPQPASAFVLPAAAIDAAKSRFRQAGRRLGLGVAFETGSTDGNGNVKLVVEARQKKVLPAKKSAV